MISLEWMSRRSREEWTEDPLPIVFGKERRTFFVSFESIKREPKIRGINKCRCDERLQTKTKEFTRLPYTGLVLELEHLKILLFLMNR